MFVNNWFYQLQNVEPNIVARIDAAIKVIDPTKDGAVPFTAAEVALMRGNAGGRILAYLSIGEAEDYRPYWQESWHNRQPEWLEKFNPQWAGNYKVKYWYPAWQELVMMQLSAIISAGFDGVYLDIIDGYEYWENRFPTAGEEMEALIRKIRDHARSRNSKFLVVPQNGESLITATSGTVLEYVDGWAIEDLYYGDPVDGEPNTRARTLERMGNIDQVLDDDKFVLLVEYPKMAYWGQVVAAANHWRAYGLTPYVTTRPLDMATGVV